MKKSFPVGHFAAIAFAPMLLTACPKKMLVADKVAPDNPTAADARGSESVYVIEAKGQPLIVDWQPEARGDLEVAMKEGVAVVGFSEKGLRLLKDCHIDGQYGFIGVNTKEQVVRLLTAEEVKANLPGAGLGLLAKLGGEFGQSQALEIAIVMVGKKKTTWANASKKDLKGQCAGATHFVRGATIGAFAMRSGAKGKASTVAEIFGGGASASAAKSSDLANKDGLIDACRKALPDSNSPPQQCGSLIRLELAALSDEAVKKDTPPSDTPTVVKNDESEACPTGFVFAEGKCTKPTTVESHVCRFGDVQDCSVQCEKGNMASCDALGVMFAQGNNVSANPTEAAKLFVKACKGELPNGCYNLALTLFSGRGLPEAKDKAHILAQKACMDGHAQACAMAARQYHFGDGVAEDLKSAAKLYLQACKGGDKGACSDLGVMAHAGQGINQDDKIAAGLFKMACDGGAPIGCSNLGYLVEVGKGVKQDRATAAAIYQKACQQSTAECLWWGVAHQTGLNGTVDMNVAAAEWRKTCDASKAQGASSSGQLIACALVSELLGDKQPLDMQFLKQAVSVWSASCKSGDMRDCAQLGVAVLALGNKPLAQQTFAMACKGGDQWACAMAKHPRVR
ncbi:MAG: tetratricopeptide repeat protein [Polyangiaceae bacterium]